MKKYEKATIDVIVLDEKDAITTSGRYTSWDGNWGGQTVTTSPKRQ